jgi:uncharacterized protein
MSHDTLPVPLPTPDTQAWFDRIDAGELTVPRCASCAMFFLYPRSVCPRCAGRVIDLVPAAGTGVVASFVVNHRAPKGFDAPYVVALVELAEGPLLMGTVVTDDPDSLAVDTPVVVAFQERNGRRVVQFELAEARA